MIGKKILLSVTALGFVCAGAAQARAAQEENPPVYFYPSDAWSSASGPGGSCGLNNQFNNGFALSFNGSGGEVRSLGVDFRQDIFQPGQSYDVSLGVPGQPYKTISGRADTSAILGMDISGQQEIYRAARDAAALDVAVEGNSFRFYLTGFASAAKGLDQCMTGGVNTGSSDTVKTEAVKEVKEEIIPVPSPGAVPSRKALYAPGQRMSNQQEGKEVAAAVDAAGIAPPPGQTNSYKSPAPKIHKEQYKMEADYTGPDTMEPASGSSPGSGYEPGYRGDPDMARKISELESTIQDLKQENNALNEEVRGTVRASEQERVSISSENWNLEKATMRYAEAERQVKRLAEQVQRERAQCNVAKKDLEGQLFDPQITDQQQLARLADLEEKLGSAQKELENQRVRYEERIRLLENQRAAQ